jgi:hypothetical protein
MKRAGLQGLARFRFRRKPVLRLDLFEGVAGAQDNIVVR